MAGHQRRRRKFAPLPRLPFKIEATRRPAPCLPGQPISALAMAQAPGTEPIHYYAFEFYALDTKLDLPASATREDLLRAMDGYVIRLSTIFMAY